MESEFPPSSLLLSSSGTDAYCRFGTAAVVKGLKEAGEDDSIGAVVLRIDSGGGGVSVPAYRWQCAVLMYEYRLSSRIPSGLR